MSTLRVNTIQDSTGSSSPTINGLAKAWVNFNGTGTVAIRASLNVSSITDNNTGNFTVNMTTAMTDSNYSAVGSCGTLTGGVAGVIQMTALSTSNFQVETKKQSDGSTADSSINLFAVFR